ncbi:MULTISPECIES: hypothetical protein [unclassified Methanoculleus]|jgi:hypothetical protein|uniref:Uncharacterized protein n=1 Tax=Methanoculleus palmolei TaxID=72612 RepID=A0ABD8A8T9_9EURY|nr:hypothetical protein R6Y95_08840 [Methanoculleus palmolei]
MKVRIHAFIAMIALIVVLATAGCLEPTGTAVNTTTPEPTPEPCETCTVPEGFCGPSSVCPGEPVNGVYVFTDKNVYRIGEVVEFGIVNCGDGRIMFAHPSPWRIERWITNASGGMPGNDTDGTWEMIGYVSGFVQTTTWPLHPGETETVRWNTTGWNTPEWGKEVRPVDDNVTLTPGIYRIQYPWIGISRADRIQYVEGNLTFTKEFEFV